MPRARRPNQDPISIRSQDSRNCVLKCPISVACPLAPIRRRVRGPIQYCRLAVSWPPVKSHRRIFAPLKLIQTDRYRKWQHHVVSSCVILRGTWSTSCVKVADETRTNGQGPLANGENSFYCTPTQKHYNRLSLLIAVQSDFVSNPIRELVVTHLFHSADQPLPLGRLVLLPRCVSDCKSSGPHP